MRLNLRWLPLLVFGITLVEVLVLSRVAHALGFGLLIAWLGSAALLGVGLLRQARRRAARSGVAAGAMGLEIADRAVISAAAVLFIIPGFLSDLVAVALLVPGNRRALARALVARFGAAFPAANEPFERDVGSAASVGPGHRRADGDRPTPRDSGRRSGHVIEGDFIRRDDSKRDKP